MLSPVLCEGWRPGGFHARRQFLPGSITCRTLARLAAARPSRAPFLLQSSQGMGTHMAERGSDSGGPPAAPPADHHATDPLRSILTNSSLLIGAQVIASVMAMVFTVLVSRGLGDAEFGRFHLALSLTTILGVAVEFGLSQVLARSVARQPALARPYLRRALVTV